MKPLIATPEALVWIVRELTPRREGWRMVVDAGIDDVEDAYFVRISAYPEQIATPRCESRHCRFLVREVDLRRALTPRYAVDHLKDLVDRAWQLMWPRPLPVFRIGTKPHLKRLVPRPAK